MKKDRFVAFFDAIMAIIMTIVVLEFVIPSGPKWSDLNGFWTQLSAYFVSFFWLGVMWINLHSTWHHVERISRPILFVNLFTLFFASLIPFLTVYVGNNIRETVPQLLYGVDVILITICNQISLELLSIHNEDVKKRVKFISIAFFGDLFIKVIGATLCVTVFPQAAIISTVVSMAFLFIIFGLRKKRS